MAQDLSDDYENTLVIQDNILSVAEWTELYNYEDIWGRIALIDDNGLQDHIHLYEFKKTQNPLSEQDNSTEKNSTPRNRTVSFINPDEQVEQNSPKKRKGSKNHESCKKEQPIPNKHETSEKIHPSSKNNLAVSKTEGSYSPEIGNSLFYIPQSYSKNNKDRGSVVFNSHVENSNDCKNKVREKNKSLADSFVARNRDSSPGREGKENDNRTSCINLLSSIFDETKDADKEDGQDNDCDNTGDDDPKKIVKRKRKNSNTMNSLKKFQRHTGDSNLDFSRNNNSARLSIDIPTVTNPDKKKANVVPFSMERYDTEPTADQHISNSKFYNQTERYWVDTTGENFGTKIRKISLKNKKALTNYGSQINLEKKTNPTNHQQESMVSLQRIGGSDYNGDNSRMGRSILEYSNQDNQSVLRKELIQNQINQLREKLEALESESQPDAKMEEEYNDIHSEIIRLNKKAITNVIKPLDINGTYRVLFEEQHLMLKGIVTSFEINAESPHNNRDNVTNIQDSLVENVFARSEFLEQRPRDQNFNIGFGDVILDSEIDSMAIDKSDMLELKKDNSLLDNSASIFYKNSFNHQKSFNQIQQQQKQRQKSNTKSHMKSQSMFPSFINTPATPNLVKQFSIQKEQESINSVTTPEVDDLIKGDYGSIEKIRVDLNDNILKLADDPDYDLTSVIHDIYMRDFDYAGLLLEFYVKVWEQLSIYEKNELTEKIVTYKQNYDDRIDGMNKLYKNMITAENMDIKKYFMNGNLIVNQDIEELSKNFYSLKKQITCLHIFWPVQTKTTI